MWESLHLRFPRAVGREGNGFMFSSLSIRPAFPPLSRAKSECDTFFSPEPMSALAILRQASGGAAIHCCVDTRSRVLCEIAKRLAVLRPAFYKTPLDSTDGDFIFQSCVYQRSFDFVLVVPEVQAGQLDLSERDKWTFLRDPRAEQSQIFRKAHERLRSGSIISSNYNEGLNLHESPGGAKRTLGSATSQSGHHLQKSGTLRYECFLC